MPTRPKLFVTVRAITYGLCDGDWICSGGESWYTSPVAVAEASMVTPVGARANVAPVHPAAMMVLNRNVTFSLVPFSELLVTPVTDESKGTAQAPPPLEAVRLLLGVKTS